MIAYVVGAAVVGIIAYVVYEKKHPIKPHPGPIQPKGGPTVADNVFANGKAKASAMALYDFIKSHGTPSGDKSFQDLVRAFQQAHNSDPEAFKLTLAIPTNGVFDVKTSSALTLYTHDPIPADPNSPLPRYATTADIMNATPDKPAPVVAAHSAYNLWMYLQKNKDDGSVTEKQLIRQFQFDWNNDPTSGPKSPLAKYSKFNKVLTVNGILDANTKKALGTLAGATIK